MFQKTHSGGHLWKMNKSNFSKPNNLHNLICHPETATYFKKMWTYWYSLLVLTSNLFPVSVCKMTQAERKMKYYTWSWVSWEGCSIWMRCRSSSLRLAKTINFLSKNIVDSWTITFRLRQGGFLCSAPLQSHWGKQPWVTSVRLAFVYDSAITCATQKEVSLKGRI